MTEHSWGGLFEFEHDVTYVRSAEQPLPTRGPLLPFGNGRSYGDSCLVDGGTLLHTRLLDRVVRFDEERGIVRCEAGVLLGDILDLVTPQGWFLPVVPGTKAVTVGGAIANDIHGKNHARRGSFGVHVPAFELVRSDGARCECRPDNDHADLYRATIGGLGLTGLVTWADIELMRVPGSAIAFERMPLRRLDQFFELTRDSASSHEYAVAWIDCRATGASVGRGYFTRANHAPGPNHSRVPPLRFPFVPPVSLVNQLSLWGVNEAQMRIRGRSRKSGTLPADRFLFELDGVRDWNRMYGRCGFYQHQCVLPPAGAETGIRELLERVGGSRAGSFLVVLKTFGSIPSPGLLSFPRPGTTLAIDFPNRGGATLRLLDELDRIVMAHGGAIYPAKDARMSPETFAGSCRNIDEFKTFVDPAFGSAFQRRVMPQGYTRRSIGG